MIGRILRSFRHAPPPPIDLRPRPTPPQPAHEKDWAAGDRAECIIPVAPDFSWRVIATGVAQRGPKRGDILRVVDLFADEHSVWLKFAGFESVGFYPAGHFRKLRACDTDFREQLRSRVPPAARKQPLRLPAPKAIPEHEVAVGADGPRNRVTLP